MTLRLTLRQLLRFGVTGVVSNLVLFAVFMALLRWGLSASLAITVTFALGLLQTFFLNRSWTFSHEGRADSALRRYFFLHLACYAFNLGLVMWLVDAWGWSPAWVQAGAMVAVAAMQFTGQKFWVFRSPDAR